MTFIIPITVRIFGDTVAINVPLIVPAIERTEAVIRVCTVFIVVRSHVFVVMV